MYQFHSRLAVRCRGAHETSIPASQTEALSRRHTLDEQQRLYREHNSASTSHRGTPRPRRPT